MSKAPFDAKGLSQRELADLLKVGESTVAGWKKDGQMPYWVTLIPLQADPLVAQLEAEVTRLNIVIDELIKRLAR
jgi:transcriptional regulator with XRE-family HTH domain